MGNENYFDRLREEIATFEDLLRPLEGGKMHLGDSHVGEPWRDGTQAQIDHLKKNIALYKFLIERHEHAARP